MMKTYKTFRLVFFYVMMATLVLSCKKTSDKPAPHPGPVPVIGKLAKIEYPNGEYDSLFYNSDLQVVKIKQHTNTVTPFDEVYTFEYDANKKLTHINTNTAERYDYLYVGGLLTAVTHYEANVKSDFRIYDYTNGKLTNVEEYYRFDPNTPGFELIAEHELLYHADGNLKEEINYSFTPQTRTKYRMFSTAYSDYDNKLSSTEVMNRFVYMSQIPLATNNPKRIIHKDEVSGVKTEFNLEYTYNDFSNPLTRKMSYTSGGQVYDVLVKYSYY